MTASAHAEIAGLGTAQLPAVLATLDAWLETMRQPGGHGGPVAHWWQSRYQYAGPGLDWRYEGILAGYALLARKTGDARWHAALDAAVDDLISGQRPDGTYRASQFEMNPGVLGTPHESAATLGTLLALPLLGRKGAALTATERNLNAIVRRLWDPRTGGFDDRPGVPSRVPNKLATLSLAFLAYTEATGDARFLPHARAALDDVLRYQVAGGALDGAVHQYDPGTGRGDGRFFPLYNARCVPALVRGASVFGEQRYGDAAHRIGDFLRRTMHPDGSWPQILYLGGGRAEWPRWVAGVADILLAFRALDTPLPPAALERLLAGQLPSGGFRTAQGFGSQILQVRPSGLPDFRDVTPVVGWNDKVFRLLCDLLPAGAAIPDATPSRVSERVLVGTSHATFLEDETAMCIALVGGESVYRWSKDAPWAETRGRVLVR